MRLIGTLLLLLWAQSDLSAQTGFQVSPGKLFFRQLANQPGTQTVRITNPSPKPMVVECTFSDWKRDSLAQKVYSAPGTLPHSLSKYLHANPESFELKAGESRLIEVNLSLPDGEDRMAGNSMLMVTQIIEKEGGAKAKNLNTGMTFQVQMGIHVYNEPPQLTARNIDILDVTYGMMASNPRSKDSTGSERFVRALISNIGERVTEGTVRFELTHSTTLDEWKSKPQDFNSLPGDRFYIAEGVPASLAKGKYSMITVVDFGPDQPLKVAESEIEIK